MPKYKSFFNEITKLRSDIRGKENTTLVKTVIGDSINNNRTPTVTQTVRFLYNVGEKKFAAELYVAYLFIGDITKFNRVNRTDSVDLQEFVNNYREVIMNKGNFRDAMGRLLSKVG